MTSIYHQIKKDSATVHREILTNIVKMLVYRKWVPGDKTYTDKLITNLVNDKNEEKIYTIKLEKSLLDFDTYDPNEDKIGWKTNEGKNIVTGWNNFDGKSIVILLLHQKVSGKSPLINDFLTKYSNLHKIVVVEGISEKVRQSISINKHTEVFTEDEFMLNLTDHVCCPKLEILNNQQITDLLKSFKVTRRQLPKIYDMDIESRHIYLKRGQVIRIVRNSEMSGQSVAYRIAIHKGSTAM